MLNEQEIQSDNLRSLYEILSFMIVEKLRSGTINAHVNSVTIKEVPQGVTVSVRLRACLFEEK